MLKTIDSWIALVAASYLLGSVPFGLIIVRWKAKIDIRKIGSGNIGATNVKRILGTGWAATTLVLDALKGLLPVLVATWISDTSYQWLPAITALAAIAGHTHPIFFGFRPGGKGVATASGCLLIAAPTACIVVLLIFVPVVYLTRRVSLGSLVATFCLAPATWFTTQDPALCAATILIMVLIVNRHKENILRIARGSEPRL